MVVFCVNADSIVPTLLLQNLGYYIWRTIKILIFHSVQAAMPKGYITNGND